LVGSTLIFGWNDNSDNDPDYINKNYFEMWTGVKDSNDLSGTGFNNGVRIMYGVVTAVSEGTTRSNPTIDLDQHISNDWPGQLTLTIGGSQQISVAVWTADAAYFPGFTPDKIDKIYAYFNTSTITPFQQADPSRKFVSGWSGADGSTPVTPPNVNPVLGTINAQSGPDLMAQADANQSFDITTKPPVGACRVTYGGNDQNGNVDPKKFGEACSPDPSAKGRVTENCYTFGGQAGAPSATSAKGGPFGEHTHHQKSGPAGDFVFHAGTHSAPKATRIDEIKCKDEGACRQAAANGNFKQIDFDGTGSFRELNDAAKEYLYKHGGPANVDTNMIFYFRVDMDDLGEPGNQWATGKKSVVADLKSNCQAFFNDDKNNPLATADPLFMNYFGGYSQVQACSSCPDVYQIRIYSGDSRENPGNLMYEVRGFLTGGNIQIHRLIR